MIKILEKAYQEYVAKETAAGNQPVSPDVFFSVLGTFVAVLMDGGTNGK